MFLTCHNTLLLFLLLRLLLLSLPQNHCNDMPGGLGVQPYTTNQILTERSKYLIVTDRTDADKARLRPQFVGEETATGNVIARKQQSEYC